MFGRKDFVFKGDERECNGGGGRVTGMAWEWYSLTGGRRGASQKIRPGWLRFGVAQKPINVRDPDRVVDLKTGRHLVLVLFLLLLVHV